jgi:hypothetical protein
MASLRKPDPIGYPDLQPDPEERFQLSNFARKGLMDSNSFSMTAACFDDRGVNWTGNFNGQVRNPFEYADSTLVSTAAASVVISNAHTNFAILTI